MDILNSIVNIANTVSGLSEKLAKDAVRKKHVIRRRFYTLLIDYLQAPGNNSPSNFFSWYMERLDERMRMSPQWLDFYYKVTKQKNEASFRKFLQSCDDAAASEPNIINVIEPWLPDDEHRIIASSSSADITKVIKIALEMCEEKEQTQKQVRNALLSNFPIIGMGFFFHWILYSFVYTSFIIPGFADNTPWEEMNLLEQNYVRYDWILNNYFYVIAAVVLVWMAFSWSIKNWNGTGVFIREHYIDYLPPYSLAKVNDQYNILLIISSFMRSGKSFPESLYQAKQGATPYIQYQVNKIIENDTVQAHVALNSFYLGMMGSDIRERANNVSLEKSISTQLPRMQEEKRERFNRIIGITMMLSFKPVIYLSLGASIVPLFITIYDSLPKT
jgi:hypothetical protein